MDSRQLMYGWITNIAIVSFFWWIGADKCVSCPFVAAGLVLGWMWLATKENKYPHPVSSERLALGQIVEKLGDEQLSTLGREIRDIALTGLKQQ